MLVRMKRKKKKRIRKYISTKNKQYILKNTIKAPENLSMIENMENYMDFLDEIDYYGFKRQDLELDFSEVKNITPDGLLMIIAYLNRYKNRNPQCNINGNSPDNNDCFRIFEESCFYQYAFSNHRPKKDDILLSIRSDMMICPDDAGAVAKFVRNKLGINDLIFTKAIYTVIMESMTNVRDHAYKKKKGRGEGYWWLMAMPAKNKNTIRFALVDNGKGIPKTMRKKLISDDVLKKDGELIQATVLENKRSSTKLHYRGRGLPKMKELVTSSKIKNLNIISRKGGYFIDEDKTYDLNDKEYFGTVICWEFFKE